LGGWSGATRTLEVRNQKDPRLVIATLQSALGGWSTGCSGGAGSASERKGSTVGKLVRGEARKLAKRGISTLRAGVKATNEMQL